MLEHKQRKSDLRLCSSNSELEHTWCCSLRLSMGGAICLPGRGQFHAHIHALCTCQFHAHIHALYVCLCHDPFMLSTCACTMPIHVLYVCLCMAHLHTMPWPSRAFYVCPCHGRFTLCMCDYATMPIFTLCLSALSILTFTLCTSALSMLPGG